MLTTLKTNQITYSTYQNTLKAALDVLTNPSINSERPTLCAITQSFGVIETTLRRILKNNSVPNCTGPSIILSTHEEMQLVGYCKNMQKLGFGLIRSGVNYCIMEIIRSNNHDHLFTDKGSDKAWWIHFMKEHSDLSFRVSQALSEVCAQRANPIIIKDHFDKLHQIIKKYTLTTDHI